MPVLFTLTSGEPLSFTAGLPPQYQGPVITGANASWSNHVNVSIILQEYHTRHMSITLTCISWKAPERIIVESEFAPVVFVRTLLSKYLCEVIKATGEFRLDAKHFYAIAASKWQSLIEPGGAGDYYLLDLTWNIEELQHPVVCIDPLSLSALLPQKLMELPCCNSISLQRHFEDLIRLDYSSTSQRSTFHELMNNCLAYVKREIDDQMCIKKSMKNTDWHYVNEAKRVIHESLDRRLSTPEISIKIGVNRERLKKVFKKATGFGIDEYRKYHLFIRVARNMVNAQDIPLKSITVVTGYESESSMLRAFKTAMFCTPGELRTGEWDLTRLNAIPETKWEHVD